MRLSLWDWTQTAVAFDGSDEIHYVNGIMMESDACEGPVTVNDNPLRIGARAGVRFHHHAVHEVDLVAAVECDGSLRPVVEPEPDVAPPAPTAFVLGALVAT